MTETFESRLCKLNIPFVTDEPMSRHTTFRIGGTADCFVTPRTVQQVEQAFATAKETETPVFCIGRGSNLLVADDGLRGAVISLGELNEISVSGTTVTAGAGATLSALCLAAQNAGLTGLEFAYGIPGSVGGALFMNAGAYGGEMATVVSSAVCLTGGGEVITVPVGEMALGYRTSAFRQNGWIILSVTVELTVGNREEIGAKMEELIARRKEKQPLEFPSAGSTFKRPVGHFAGALIEQSNLKGCTVGGAEVSRKHAGFVINRGKATAKDVAQLIETVQQTVLRDSGVFLEPEVIFWGDIKDEKER